MSVGFGLGLVPVAPGTFGSLLGPPLVWSVRQLVPSAWGQFTIGILLILLGVPICNIGARRLGKKEIAAFFVVFALVSVSWKSAGAGFLLFRLFDITKPWPIRRLEKLPHGWGVMADDLLAGLFSCIFLFAVMHWLLPYFS
jgi:phosphatidylglycerophosphatase A